MADVTATSDSPEQKHLSADHSAPAAERAPAAEQASSEPPAHEAIPDSEVLDVEETTPAGEAIHEQAAVAPESADPEWVAESLVADAQPGMEPVPEPLIAETPLDAEPSADEDSVQAEEEPEPEQAKKPVRTRKAKAKVEAKPEEVAAPPAAPTDVAVTENPEDVNKKWYVVKVQSGREESIKESIERRVKIEGLEEYFGEILIPVEKEKVMVRGKRVERERKLFPGYIMARVEFNDQILYLFRETSGVGDFVGGGPNQKPLPMSQREVDQMFGKRAVPDRKPGTTASASPYSLGERVKVKEGVFSGMEGDIKEVLEAKEQVRVELFVLGRPVSVELDYWQVEPV